MKTRKLLALLLLFGCLAACGGLYKVDPIIRSDKKTTEWSKCNWYYFCLLCTEEAKHHFINPYTYNPSEITGNNEETKGSMSLYQKAATVVSPASFVATNITDLQGFADILRDRTTTAAGFVFSQISSSSALPHPLQTHKVGQVPPPQFQSAVIATLNKQLQKSGPTFDLYSTVGFKSNPQYLSNRLKNLANIRPTLKGNSLLQFNKLVLEEAFSEFLTSKNDLLEEARLSRNMLQQAILRVSDKETAKHLSAIKGTQVNANMLLGLSAIGLSSYAALATDAIAMAAASGTIAARSLFNEQVYRDMLVETIIGTVISSRNEYLTKELTPKFDQGVLMYNVEQAISDAERYHEMGSFYYGLQRLRQDAEQANKDRMEATANNPGKVLKDINNGLDDLKKALDNLKAQGGK